MSMLFGLTGHPGSGKTHLMLRMIPLLKARGLTVSVLRQTPPHFDIDKPGKDSHRHREAGATEVLVASVNRWALMHEYRGQPELPLDQLRARMSPVDMVLVEGFPHWDIPRLEVWRAELGKAPLFPHVPRVAAVASTGPVPGLDRPFLPLDDAQAIADFVLTQVGP